MSVAAGTLRARRVEGAPLVAVRVGLAGGARREAMPGLALLTGRALVEGTARRDWRAIALAAEAHGMTVSGFASAELTGLAVDALAEEWERALELAAELLWSAAFPPERLAWLARQAAAELEAEADEADVATGRAFAALLYGEHPKGRPLQGDAASLARIAPADCARYHAEALARGGCVAVAGAIDEARVLARLESLFGALGPAAERGFRPPAPPPAAARRRQITTRARDQAHLYVGQLTVPRHDPDCAPLELAAVALGAGSGLSGRIPARIRDREGLAYHASADAVAGAGLDAGRFVAYVGTSPATVAAAERAVVEEVVRVLEAGLSAAEIEEARSYLLGREPFRRETARQWADLAVVGAVEELPLADAEWSRARIAAVSAAEVAAALSRRLDPATLSVTVGLPGGEAAAAGS